MRYATLMLFLVFGVGVAGEAHAVAVRCEGCTDSQAVAKARSLGVGEHVISSFSTNRIWQFEIIEGSGGEPGVPPFLFAIEKSVAPTIQAAFADARVFYEATEGSFKGAYFVRAEDLGLPGLTSGTTAFDVVTNFNLRSQIGDRLTEPLPEVLPQIDRAVEKLIYGLFAVVGVGDASIEITVLFNDGSTVKYRLDHNVHTGQYMEGRSRTATGQAIPDGNTPEYQGTWLGNLDQPALADHMRRLGARVITIGSGSSVEYMECTWDGTTLECKVRKSSY